MDFDLISDTLEFLISNDKKASKEYSLFGSEKYSLITKEDLLKRRYSHNTNLRIGLGIWSAAFVSYWIIQVAYILTNNDKTFCLSDSVLITLITTTSINIIGIVLITMKDIFDGNDKD